MPSYYLIEFYKDLFLIVFDEWSELCNIHGYKVVKPILISINTKNSRNYNISGMNFWSLKNNDLKYFTEREIYTNLKQLGLKLNEQSLVWGHHLLIKDNTILKRWDAIKIELKKSEFYDSIIYFLSKIIDLPPNKVDVRLLGSRIYCDNINKTTDYDFAIALSPKQAIQLRKEFSILRTVGTDFMPKDTIFPFPFKVNYQNCLIDFFPTPNEYMAHPLFGIRILSKKIDLKFAESSIEDDSYSNFSFPYLTVDGIGLMICSNGLRGVFKKNDIIKYYYREVEVYSELKDEKTIIRLIEEPHLQIEDCLNYITYKRDTLWLD
ncbi:MAG: hypothetical protein IT271_13510 [Chitinophagales bacterium]|nr:hypothetical protein [Chitinophagales bacterium]